MSVNKTPAIETVKPTRQRTPEEIAAIVAQFEAREAELQAEAELAAIAREFTRAKKAEADAKAEAERLRGELLKRTTEAAGETPAAEYRVVVSRMPDQRTLDSKRLAAERPDLAALLEPFYTTRTGAVTLRVLDRK